MPKKSMDILTESMFYCLMALRREPMCGTQIAEFIGRTTLGRLQMGPATLYTILGKFEREDYIREIRVEGRRRTYQITPRGLNAYTEELSRLKACVADAEGGS